MSAPLTREDLDRAVQMGCGVPGCTHQNHTTLYLDQKCHPKAGVSVRYTFVSGKLAVECRQCKLLVFEFFVASGNSKN